MQNVNTPSITKVNYVQIQNKEKENNCYINVLIHTFAHLSKVLQLILSAYNKNTFTSYPLLQEFTSLLKQYKLIQHPSYIQNATPLNPINFKQELNAYFKEQKEFHLNEKGDPTELLTFIINAFHSQYFNPLNSNLNENETTCNQTCVAHKSFNIQLNEHAICSTCKKEVNTKYINNYFMYDIYVEETFKMINDDKLPYSQISNNLFKLNKFINDNTFLYCDQCKDNKSLKRLMCDYVGNTLIIHCIMDRVFTMVNLCYLYFAIAKYICVEDLFEVDDSNNKHFELIGMTLYFGSHYLCVFYEKENECYVLYDDTKHKEFKNWETLIEFLLKNKYYPVLLFYEEVLEQSIATYDVHDNNERLFKKQLALATTLDKESKSKPNLYTRQLSKDEFNYSNEDIWECEHCNVINSYDVYICRGCCKSNPTVQIMVKAKEQMKQKNKQQNDYWKCPYCDNVNKLSNYICGNCSYSNEVVKEIKDQKEETLIEEEEKNDEQIEEINSEGDIQIISDEICWICPICKENINKTQFYCKVCKCLNRELREEIERNKLLQQEVFYCIECKKEKVEKKDCKCKECKQKEEKKKEEASNHGRNKGKYVYTGIIYGINSKEAKKNK